MTQYEHLVKFRSEMKATDSLDGLRKKDLKARLRNLSNLLSELNDMGEVLKCHERMEAIRQKIEGFRTRWILFCAAIGGVTGIVLVAIEIWPLIRGTFFPIDTRASAPTPTLATPLQTRLPTNVVSEPATSPSNTTPLEEQRATTKPSAEPRQ